MGEVHDLIDRLGQAASKDVVHSALERQMIDIASAVLSDEDQAISLAHSGFALTTLPYRKIGEPHWVKKGHKVSLHIQSGLTGEGDYVGVPYGSYARMILIYLQTQAIKHNNPNVELGRSMHSWLSSMGLKRSGGATYKAIQEQANRISACSLSFIYDDKEMTIRENGQFVDNAIIFKKDNDERQMALWKEQVTLNEKFFASLKKHPVPLHEEAIRSLSSKSLALDIYIWLAYRLHKLSSVTPLKWASVTSQFGTSYKNHRQFRRDFTNALQLALAAYPEAQVDIDSWGIALHPSRSPVSARVYQLGAVR